MSDTIIVKNNSGKSYLFPEIGILKPITSDPKKTYEFKKEDVKKSILLGSLIKSGSFQIVEKETDSELDKKLSTSEIKIIPKPDSINEYMDSFSFGEVSEGKVNDTTSRVETMPETKLKEVWWRGPGNDMGGYGKMNFYCLAGIANRFKIQLDLSNMPSFRNTITKTKEMEQMLKNVVDEKATSVWAIMPPKFPSRHGRKIYYTMLETEGVHASFLDRINYCDELWVPSLNNMEIFQKEKVKPKIVHIPLGVDTELYKKMDKRKIDMNKFKIKTKGFTFLSVFGWSLRKGTDVLFKAYLNAFTKNDDVSLVVVSRYNGSSSVENIKRIRDEIQGYIKRFCKDPANHPHIVHIGTGIPEEDMPSLYNLADCFVLPTRGEGFGLPMIEAGACEKPVISTRCGGQLDFMTDENSYLLDIEGYGIEKQEIKEISSYYEGMPFAVLGNTCLNQLTEVMRSVYTNYPEAEKKGKIMRNNIVENFTWNHTIEKVYDRLMDE